MKVPCPKCHSDFSVPDEVLLTGVAHVSCDSCQFKFVVRLGDRGSSEKKEPEKVIVEGVKDSGSQESYAGEIGGNKAKFIEAETRTTIRVDPQFQEEIESEREPTRETPSVEAGDDPTGASGVEIADSYQQETDESSAALMAAPTQIETPEVDGPIDTAPTEVSDEPPSDEGFESFKPVAAPTPPPGAEAAPAPAAAAPPAPDPPSGTEVTPEQEASTDPPAQPPAESPVDEATAGPVAEAAASPPPAAPADAVDPASPAAQAAPAPGPASPAAQAALAPDPALPPPAAPAPVAQPNPLAIAPAPPPATHPLAASPAAPLLQPRGPVDMSAMTPLVDLGPDLYMDRSRGKGMRVFGMLVSLALIGFVLFLVFVLYKNDWSMDMSNFGKMIDRAFYNTPYSAEKTELRGLEVTKPIVTEARLSTGDKALIASGIVKNNDTLARKFVYVRAVMKDNHGRKITSTEAPADNMWTREQLAKLTKSQISLVPGGKGGMNNKLDPGQSVAYSVVVTIIPHDYSSRKYNITAEISQVEFFIGR